MIASGGVRSNLEITDSKCDVFTRKRRLCHEMIFIISTLKNRLYPYLNPCGNQLLWDFLKKLVCHFEVLFFIFSGASQHHWLALGGLSLLILQKPKEFLRWLLSHPSLSGERSQRSFSLKKFWDGISQFGMYIEITQVFGGFLLPWKTNMSPENQWVGEDVFPYWRGPLFRGHVGFRGVYLCRKLGFVGGYLLNIDMGVYCHCWADTTEFEFNSDTSKGHYRVQIVSFSKASLFFHIHVFYKWIIIPESHQILAIPCNSSSFLLFFHAKLRHYSDTVGQWYRTVLGMVPGPSRELLEARIISRLGDAGGYVFKLMKVYRGRCIYTWNPKWPLFLIGKRPRFWEGLKPQKGGQTGFQVYIYILYIILYNSYI